MKRISVEHEEYLLAYYKKVEKKIFKSMLSAVLQGGKNKKKARLNVKSETKRLNKIFKAFTSKKLKKAHTQGIKQADKQLKIIGVNVKSEDLNSYLAFNTLHKETYKKLKKMSSLIGRDADEFLTRTNFKDTQSMLKGLGKFVDNKTLRKLGLTNTEGVIIGKKTWQQGARALEKNIGKYGNFKVPYYKKNGDLHCLVDAKKYSQMVARTTTAEAHRMGTADRIKETFDNNDLVEIIGNSTFANSPCIPFEGQILSLEGRTEGYITIDQAKADGLFHPNCIHDYSVTFKVIEEYEQKGIKY